MIDLIPIAQLDSLSSSLSKPEQKFIRGVVVLVWPYSSATRSAALLIAELDFRLRSKKGQVRIQLSGAGAEAVAQARVGTGDEVVLSLEGAKWVEATPGISTPGKSVDVELLYKERIVCDIVRNGQAVTKLDINDTSPSEPQSRPSLPATPREPVRCFASPLLGPGNVLATPASSAFHRRSRVVSGELVDSPYDPFASDRNRVGHGRKRLRLSWGTEGRWTVNDQVPSPTKKHGRDDWIRLEGSQSPEKSRKTIKGAWSKTHSPERPQAPPLEKVYSPTPKATDSQIEGARTRYTQEIVDMVSGDTEPDTDDEASRAITRAFNAPQEYNRSGFAVFRDQPLSQTILDQHNVPADWPSGTGFIQAETVTNIRNEEEQPKSPFHQAPKIQESEDRSPMIEAPLVEQASPVRDSEIRLVDDPDPSQGRSLPTTPREDAQKPTIEEPRTGAGDEEPALSTQDQDDDFAIDPALSQPMQSRFAPPVEMQNSAKAPSDAVASDTGRSSSSHETDIVTPNKRALPQNLRLLEMPPPQPPMIQTSGFGPEPINRIGPPSALPGSPRTPDIRPQQSAILPLPSPFPGEDLETSYMDASTNKELDSSFLAASHSAGPSPVLPDYMFQVGFGFGSQAFVHDSLSQPQFSQEVNWSAVENKNREQKGEEQLQQHDTVTAGDRPLDLTFADASLPGASIGIDWSMYPPLEELSAGEDGPKFELPEQVGQQGDRAKQIFAPAVIAISSDRSESEDEARRTEAVQNLDAQEAPKFHVDFSESEDGEDKEDDEEQEEEGNEKEEKSSEDEEKEEESKTRDTKQAGKEEEEKEGQKEEVLKIRYAAYDTGSGKDVIGHSTRHPSTVETLGNREEDDYYNDDDDDYESDSEELYDEEEEDEEGSVKAGIGLYGPMSSQFDGASESEAQMLFPQRKSSRLTASQPTPMAPAAMARQLVSAVPPSTAPAGRTIIIDLSDNDSNEEETLLQQSSIIPDQSNGERSELIVHPETGRPLEVNAPEKNESSTTEKRTGLDDELPAHSDVPDDPLRDSIGSLYQPSQAVHSAATYAPRVTRRQAAQHARNTSEGDIQQSLPVVSQSQQHSPASRLVVQDSLENREHSDLSVVNKSPFKADDAIDANEVDDDLLWASEITKSSTSPLHDPARDAAQTTSPSFSSDLRYIDKLPSNPVAYPQLPPLQQTQLVHDSPAPFDLVGQSAFESIVPATPEASQLQSQSFQISQQAAVQQSALPPTPRLTQATSDRSILSSNNLLIVDSQLDEEEKQMKDEKFMKASPVDHFKNNTSILSPWFSGRSSQKFDPGSEIDEVETQASETVKHDLHSERQPFTDRSVIPDSLEHLARPHEALYSEVKQGLIRTLKWEEQSSEELPLTSQLSKYEFSSFSQSQATQVKGLRTDLSYYTPLVNLYSHLHIPASHPNYQQGVDVLAVVSKGTTKPLRADKGQRDFYTALRIMDPRFHLHSIRVQFFRPWRNALPVAEKGDVILLRDFEVFAAKGNVGIALKSSEGGAWCVWRYGAAFVPAPKSKVGGLDMTGTGNKPAWTEKDVDLTTEQREDIRGPPVEIGEEERDRVRELRDWWKDLGSVGLEHAESSQGMAGSTGNITVEPT